MELMPLDLQWSDVLARIALALLAGALIGLDRAESGKSAGLRTTTLVCVAACLSMLQANALLAQTGKHTDSFAVLDLMRLPLGILTGVGFIGAGAVMRRDGLVTGVTTAATLWFVTVIGLCFGGGQLMLGVLGVALGLVVLWIMHGVELRLTRDKSAWLTLCYERDDDVSIKARDELIARLDQDGFHHICRGVRTDNGTQDIEERFVVRWRERLDSHEMMNQLATATKEAHLRSTRWSMIG